MYKYNTLFTLMKIHIKYSNNVLIKLVSKIVIYLVNSIVNMGSNFIWSVMMVVSSIPSDILLSWFIEILPDYSKLMILF